MKERLKKFITEHKLIAPDDRVCVGLSGGADSVCLLLLLNDLKDELSFSLEAFHVDHHLRGESSENDRTFVIRLCEQLQVPLRIFDHDVAAVSAVMKKGTEETGRILRKQDAELCIQEGCSKIALAHHKNDQAETFLFHIARGCSIDGLASIRPINGYFIHPMLLFEKKEIVEELENRKQQWCTDQTNYDLTYSRNFLRGKILPEFEKVNPRTVSHIFDLTEDLWQLTDYLEKQTEICYGKYVHNEEKSLIIDPHILSEDPYLASRTIKRVMEVTAGRKKDLSRIHVRDLTMLLSEPAGKSINLPYEMQAVRTYNGLMIRKKTEMECFTDEIPFVAGEKQNVNGYLITSEFVSDPFIAISEKNKYTKCFDYDKIDRNCVFRTRREGDRVVVHKDGGSKKLKDLLIDCKVPRKDRDNLIVLAEGNLVHWIIGIRMGESAKIMPDTKRIIKINVNERTTL